MSCPIRVTREIKTLIVLFCAVSSLMTAVINNILLSMYMFPSYQALRLIQIVFTLIVMWIGRHADLVRLPPLDRNLVSRVWPLLLLSLGIMTTSHSEALDVIFTSSMIWRPVSVLVTLVLEKIILRVEASCKVQVCVVAMVGGAIIASADGEPVIWTHFTLIIVNNVHLAAIGVYSKKIVDSKICNICGLLYIDSLFMVLPVLIVAWSAGDLDGLTEYKAWDDPFLLGHIVMSSVIGIIQSYGVILCTQYNSALTTSVLGSLVCIFRYLLSLLSEFVFVTWLKSAGFMITVLGSLVYTYVI